MSNDLESLLEMGFDKERAEIAIKKKGDLQNVLQWLEDNQDKSIEEIKAEEMAADAPSASSLVCNECGKLFKNADLASFHATKSGHTDFAESTEEIKPLTEEEKKAKLEELREKLKAKRAVQSVTDRETQRANEKIRQKATQESQDAKEKLQREAQIREAARKRQEKIADIEARNRAKAKIEADKQERRLKAEKEKAQREGKAVPVLAPALVAPAAPAVKREPAKEARLRLQTPAGILMTVKGAESTLEELAAWVQQENGTVVTSFMITMPRKTLSKAEFGKTLKEAGLVPNASLIVS